MPKLPSPITEGIDVARRPNLAGAQPFSTASTSTPGIAFVADGDVGSSNRIRRQRDEIGIGYSGGPGPSDGQTKRLKVVLGDWSDLTMT